MRKVVTVAVVILLTALGLGASGVPAQAAPAHDEAAFVRDINNLRTSLGLAPLVVDSRLTALARDFAEKMAAAGKIYHNPDLSKQAPGGWLKLGENVGVGYDEAGLHQAFVNSPGHYRNLVDPEYTSMGIGVVHSGGRTWVVEDFMKSSQPPVVAQPTKPQPITSVTDRIARYQTVLRTHG